ncbi:MAG: hypothetical protein QM811_00605 [Pirellulales bacterium]
MISAAKLEPDASGSVLVLGDIVEDPTKSIPNYSGVKENVVWASVGVAPAAVPAADKAPAPARGCLLRAWATIRSERPPPHRLRPRNWALNCRLPRPRKPSSLIRLSKPRRFRETSDRRYRTGGFSCAMPMRYDGVTIKR